MWPYLIPLYDPDAQHWAAEARILRWLIFFWLIVGLTALFSASYNVADAETGDGLYYFKRQLIWLWIGFIGFNTIVRLPLQVILKLSPWGLFLTFGLIIATHIPGVGTEVNGATRWIAFGPMLLQPSELLKPFLVLQSAQVFGNWDRIDWNTRLGWVGLFAIILASILLQPNLSTTALCGMSLWLIALASGIPMGYLSLTAISGVATAFLSISIKEYQRLRVISFLDPWADPMGNGYQLVQSLLAIGSGGIFGTGYGLSQQKLFYLPIQYTDFIFSVFAEEFGLIGSLLLLSLLLLYATFALRVAMRCRHRVKRLVAMGVMIMLVGQSLLNIGVATGALPTTGLPLPLFSYGGSSSLASLSLAALLIRVARENDQNKVVKMAVRR
ncbi:MAG: FtsW/RodA/SpoVE family cell cycle protein [Microcystaceae cyanobacterium]